MDSIHSIDQGKEFLEKLQFRKAEEQFREAIARDSQSIDARVWLVRLSLVEKDQEGALRHLEDVLKINPNYAEAVALRGAVSMMQESYEEAVQDLEKAKSLDPELEMIYYNLAKSYRKLKQLDLAEKAARKAIEMNRRNFQAHGELSYILYKTSRAKEGTQHLLEAIRINPLFLKGYMILGQVLKTAGKTEEAIRVYRKGLKHIPVAHFLREELCGLYVAKGDFLSAYRHAVAVAVWRKSAEDYLRLGKYALALGFFDKAEKAFKKSIELNPQNPEAYSNLADVLTATNRIQEAEVYFRKAKSI